MLFSYHNVWNTCLHIINDLGYRVYLIGDPDDTGAPSLCTWNAEKGGFKFRADNPIELLGLIRIHEHVQPVKDTPDWWRIDGPNLVIQTVSDWQKTLET